MFLKFMKIPKIIIKVCIRYVKQILISILRHGIFEYLRLWTLGTSVHKSSTDPTSRVSINWTVNIVITYGYDWRTGEILYTYDIKKKLKLSLRII